MLNSSNHDSARFKSQSSSVTNSGRSYNNYMIDSYAASPSIAALSPRVPHGNMELLPEIRQKNSVNVPSRQHNTAVQSLTTSRPQNHLENAIERPILHSSSIDVEMEVNAGSERQQHQFSTDPFTAPVHKKARLDNKTSHNNRLHLKIDTNLSPIKLKIEPPGAYHPETENISPTLPTDSHGSKSDIVNSLNQVDTEISQIENQIQLLEKQQSKLEDEAAKPKEQLLEEETANESRPLNFLQTIYRENKRLAQKSHNMLAALASPAELPLYHQPSDTEVFHENIRRFQTFRTLLLAHLKRKAAEWTQFSNKQVDVYDKDVTSWLKKVDSKTIKKNLKDQKTREYFEKVFPEIKKSRDDKDRIARVGHRGVSSGYARTEAELEQIVDGINEQEEEDKKMRAYAVIPAMYDPSRRLVKYINRNGLMQGTLAEYKQLNSMVAWLPAEEAIFKEKYLDRPKQFSQIAEILDKKSLNDCVLYYYLTKKRKNYKQLLKKQVKRPHRKQALKPVCQPYSINAMRNSSEGVVENSSEPNTELTKNSDSEEVIKLAKPSLDDAKWQSCAACGVKLESYSLSHPILRSNCTQYGLEEQNYQSDWRVCANCVKLQRRRNNICPVPSCTTPRRRIRHLPLKWEELPQSVKGNILKELELDEEVTRCCSSCYEKISDILGHSGGDLLGKTLDEAKVTWVDDEQSSFKQGLFLHGRNWTQLSSLVKTKNPTQCRMFYYRNKKKLNLEQIYKDYKTRKFQDSGGTDTLLSDESMDDDDFLEDNDLSSDAECGTVRDTKKPFSDSSITPKLVNGDDAEELPEVKINSDNLMVKEEIKPRIKQEKVDYDSSATASADEEIVVESKSQDMKPEVRSISPLPQLPTVKREPGVIENEDKILNLPFTSTCYASQPLPLANNRGSTSVKELIDSAIENALSNPNQSDPSVSSSGVRLQRAPSVNGHIPVSPFSRALRSENSNVFQVDKSSAAKEESHRRLAHLPPYKGDPRDFIPVRERDLSVSSTFPYNHVGEGVVNRVPPPAHSHHTFSGVSHPEQRSSQERKSPGKAQDPSYIFDGRKSPAYSRASPAVNKTQILSNSPSSKREGLSAGGSILQGTSVSHMSQQHAPQMSRFEAGSISHGTPRSQQQDVKSFTSSSPVNRLDDRPVKSPRQQPIPAMPSMLSSQLPLQQQQYDRLIDPKILQEFYRTYGGFASFPPFPNMNMSVLHNDFMTAKQMSDSSNVRGSVPPFSAKSVKEEKKDVITSQPAPVNMMSTMMMMANNPKLFGGLLQDQQNLLTVVPPAGNVPHNLMLNKDDSVAKPWGSHLSNSMSRSDSSSSLQRSADVSKSQTRLNNVHGGAASKKGDTAPAPTDLSRHSVSPHRKVDHKTQYEKDIEEIRRERIRTDSDKSLPDSDNAVSFMSTVKPPESFNMARMIQSGMRDLSPKPDMAQFIAHKTTDFSKRKEDVGNKVTKEIIGKDTLQLERREERRSNDDDSRQKIFSNKIDSDSRKSPVKPVDLSNQRNEDDLRRKIQPAHTFSSKRLAEVSKALESEHLHKDASALFSSSFEKDSHEKTNDVSPHVGLELPVTMTASSIIDAIIMKQINESDSKSPSSTSLQHTSVIMPPKKPRSQLHPSRSDTDIPGMVGNLSGSSTQSPNGMPSLMRPSSGNNLTVDTNNRPITLTDKINEIIVNDYKSAKSTESDMNLLTPQRYRIEDVEPISPPNSSINSSRSVKTSTNSANVAQPFGNKSNSSTKKHAGIRSLLGADISQDGYSHKADHHDHFGSINQIDYVKSKIEEAIRSDIDHEKNNLSKLHNRNALPNASPGLPLMASGHTLHNERLSEDITNKESSKKRALEAMLAPAKKVALSPRQVKSPEEVDLYAAPHNNSLHNTNKNINYMSTSSNNLYKLAAVGSPFAMQSSMGYYNNSKSASGNLLSSNSSYNTLNRSPVSSSVLNISSRTNGSDHKSLIMDESSSSTGSHSIMEVSANSMEYNRYKDTLNQLRQSHIINQKHSPLSSGSASSRQSPLLSKSSALHSKVSSDNLSPRLAKEPTSVRHTLLQPVGDIPKDKMRKPLLSEQYETLSDDD